MHGRKANKNMIWWCSTCSSSFNIFPSLITSAVSWTPLRQPTSLLMCFNLGVSTLPRHKEDFARSEKLFMKIDRHRLVEKKLAAINNAWMRNKRYNEFLSERVDSVCDADERVCCWKYLSTKNRKKNPQQINKEWATIKSFRAFGSFRF